jgi:catechol 2,3-dioxygenase-like lactoylglutathione lyase family enzyme
MKFHRTGNIALHVADLKAAVSFYRDILNLPVKEFSDDEILFEMESGLFYVTENPEWQGLVEEYEVADLDTARSVLEAGGCNVVRWEGRGGDCYMQDPFGMFFNLWEV